MSIKTTRWDSAEHLQTDEDVALYLQACMEEGGEDPDFMIHVLGVLEKAKHGGSERPEAPQSS